MSNRNWFALFLLVLLFSVLVFKTYGQDTSHVQLEHGQFARYICPSDGQDIFPYGVMLSDTVGLLSCVDDTNTTLWQLPIELPSWDYAGPIYGGQYPTEFSCLDGELLYWFEVQSTTTGNYEYWVFCGGIHFQHSVYLPIVID